MPRIPLIEDLTKGPIPPGNQLLVEYDPSSQWYNASSSIAAGWVKTGGTVAYNANVQTPTQIRLQLHRLGLNVEELERDNKLQIFDWYTTSLGQKSKEKYFMESLKVHDLSVEYLKEDMQQPADPNVLIIGDSASVLARFNEEKAWVEFFLTRSIPAQIRTMRTTIRGLLKGAHSEWAYKQLEGASDGIIDFRLEETADKVGEEARSMMRIRFMKNVGFDARWHSLRVADNLEVTLAE